MNHKKQISSRLSLRKPQGESLDILARVLEKIELSKEADLKRSLETIQGMYSSVKDFERDFPSICFALATGVGKTRLMGAFISYLYLSGMSRNFFVLAPGLTIYEKLKEDFRPNSPKYVFQGIPEFATTPPVIITGEDYASGEGIRDEDRSTSHLFEFNDSDRPYINIFNISKINATENTEGARQSQIPRIKRLQETIGESYFDYLSNLPDLVMLMDESHCYRALGGANAINELKPVLGIELTATPKTAGQRSVDFKNIIYAYSLSEAIKDGFVKIPAVATREDFKPENYDAEELDEIKLVDGIHNHEHVKAELAAYASQYNKEIVKPFMLVVAKDTKHAGKLRKLMEEESFFDGKYKNKIIEIHSKQSGEEKDENIQRLISIEDPNEPTETVIHVNKLKEGWDVKNLYTIVPLRASAADILTEQTIGRGLRLPYGSRTGVEVIDRLTIIAHDKFQEIVDHANNPNSIIHKKITIGDGGDVPIAGTQVITVPSFASITLTGSSVSGDDRQINTPAEIIIKDPQHQQVAENTMKVLAEDYESLNSSGELSMPKIKEKIIRKVSEIIGQTHQVEVKKVVEKVIKHITKNTIDIPNIILEPTSEVEHGFNDFDLDGLERLNFQPVSQEILIKELQTNKRSLLSSDGTGYKKEKKPEDYIIGRLSEHDWIDYETHAELLYKLAGQVVSHFKTYLSDESDVANVLIHNRREITEFIIKQLEQNQWKTETNYRVKVIQGFRMLKPCNFTMQKDATPRNFMSVPEANSDVKKIVFGGFEKCCYPMQKFDSVEGELRFAQILEGDPSVIRWMKPARGSFQIEYKDGSLYEPDFIVETEDARYLCEPKMALEMSGENVLDKQDAAVRWCQHATKHAQENGGKPWHYALIPHNVIALNCSFDKLMNNYVVRGKDEETP